LLSYQLHPVPSEPKRSPPPSVLWHGGLGGGGGRDGGGEGGGGEGGGSEGGGGEGGGSDGDGESDTFSPLANGTRQITMANEHSEGIKKPSRLRMRGRCVASTCRRPGGQLGNRRGRPGAGRGGGEEGRG
jgi:hypothetical protein